MRSLKKVILGGIVGFALLIASNAHAASWTDAFKILYMETTADGMFRIVPLAGTVANNSTNDPNNCVSGSTPIDSFNFYASNTNITQVQKDLIVKTLLAAYVGGRHVKLNISSGACEGGRPAYGQVAIYPM